MAAWAQWRAQQQAQQCTLDTAAPAWDALRQALPADLVLGLVGVPAAQAAALQDRGAGAVLSPQGDRLCWVVAAGPQTLAAVDAVVRAGPAAAELPVAWQGAPCMELPWAQWGCSWVLEPVVFGHLQALLAGQNHALARLAAARAQANDARFTQALQVLARHLRACAALESSGGRQNGAAHSEPLWPALAADLQALHALAPVLAPPAAATDAGMPHAGLPGGGGEGVLLAVGSSMGAAAGAAAGAQVGALIDVGTGGLSLGAGTALGALLGGAAAWVVRSTHKKTAAQEWRWQALEAACIHYLVAAHAERALPLEVPHLAARWQAEVTAAVAVHGPALEAALASPVPTAAPEDPLVPLLRTLLLGVVQRSLASPAAPAAGPQRP